MRSTDVGRQVAGMVALLILLVLVTWWVQPTFLTPYSLRTLGRDIAILSLFALGQGVVIIAGGIDLAVGSVIALVGVGTIRWLSDDPAMGGLGLPLLVVLPAMLTGATLVGTAHGWLSARLAIQPFMVTLCSLLVLRSVARGYTGDTTVSFRGTELPVFDALGNGAWLGVPIPVWILIAAVAVLLVFMQRTVHGRYVYAIGFNAEAARLSGVPVDRLQIAAFALCAFLAGLAGVLEASAIRSVAPSSSGIAYELYGITAAVLGGCALRGGQGSMLGIVVGAAVLKVLQRMIVFVGLETHWTDAVVGLVLLAAVTSDALVRRRRS